MNFWHDLQFGDKEKFTTIIEIPKLSRVKYELDKKTGFIKVDRILDSSIHYPTNYGFIPQTLCGDDDPLDVLLLSYEPLIPGCIIQAKPVGLLNMTDDDKNDEKILAAPTKDPRFNNINDISDVEPHILKEIQHFFKIYKNSQKKEVAVKEWENKEKAIEAIEKSTNLYKEKYKSQS
ncbi:MAG TPA: inorganic diphosphatase [Candidatus Wolfebacteria bacterium]|nr:inorganic diphosphatase [Candidatus Wolfebacteria bacterium]